jgi:murein DD-endopeptidase MepM/ murein hydrolase activator NlpD
VPADGTWPLSPEPEVLAEFDPPASRWGAGHRGVDLAGSVGQPVLAAQAGTVRFAGRIAGRGVVVVDHGATRTTYEPVAASVAVGDRVAAGAVLGRLELLGSHCLPRACLHWGLVRGKTYLDPLTLVGAGPVRLLPLFTGPVSEMLRIATPHPLTFPADTPAVATHPRTATPWAGRVRPGGVLAGRPAAVGPW